MRRYTHLHLPRKDGSTMIQHCEGYFQSKGEWPEDHPLPEIPPQCAELWEWYFDLRGATPAGSAGPNPISFSEIKAWKELLGLKPEPHEVEYLRLLDEEFLNSFYKTNKVGKQTAPKPIRKK